MSLRWVNKEEGEGEEEEVVCFGASFARERGGGTMDFFNFVCVWVCGKS